MTDMPHDAIPMQPQPDAVAADRVPPVPLTSAPTADPWTYPESAPPRAFTTVESVFAWLSLAAGYAFCRAFPVGDHPLGGFLLILGLFVATAIVLKGKGVKWSLPSALAAVSAVVVSSALVLCANSFLHGFAYAYALVAYGYCLYATTGNSVEKGFSNLVVVDFFKALFVLPFSSMHHLFRAMFSGKAKGSGKVLLKLLLGVALAIIPTAVVWTLLSYDNSFTTLMGNIFDFSWEDIFSHSVSLGFAIPIGMYLFGLFISSADHKGQDILTAEDCRRVSRRIKIAPPLTILAAVLPLLFIYVIFFISQWQYYISGFTGVLPETFSYAEYAREGFFQLCTVSVINLVVLVLVSLFLRRAADRPPMLWKGLALVYAVFTLVLISTALAKMAMYIDYYGLTPKRVYATWMMVVLAIVFILIGVGQFVSKLRLVVTSLAVCVICFAGLSVANVDGIIAAYNVDRYLDGSLETVDMAAMDELGDAAVPELVRLAEAMEETGVTVDNGELYDELTACLRIEAAHINAHERDIFSVTVPALKAEHALREAGWLE